MIHNQIRIGLMAVCLVVLPLGACVNRSVNDVALGVNSAVSDVNDTIEKVTGRPRARWNDFAQRHRDTIRRIVNGES